jgi:hypothetical protein
MIRLFADNERGAVAADWVTLTAGILILGCFVVYSVMGNSAGYLKNEFDALNKQYEASANDYASAELTTSVRGTRPIGRRLLPTQTQP